MSRPPNPKARLALLGDVLKLLRQRRRPVRSVVIRPDGTIEVTLWLRSQPDPSDAELDDELARFRKEHDYE